MSTKVPLPIDYSLALSHEHGLDVNVGTHETPDWQVVRRISAFQPAPSQITQEAATYDDQGSPNNDVTGTSWTLSFNVQANRSKTTGKYLPEVEALLKRTKPKAIGRDAEIEVRWYHKPDTGTPDPDDAQQGVATVGFSRVNTGADGAIEVLAITLTGKGAAEEIPNPFTGWADEPPTPTP